MNNYCEFDKIINDNNSGIEIKTKKIDKLKTLISNINFSDYKKAKEYQKEVGFYTTIFCEKYNYTSNENFDFIVDILQKEINKILKKINLKKKNPKFFIVGLGNANITADCLGIEVCKKIISTNLNLENGKISKNNFGNVFSLCPSVASQNGIYTLSIINAITKEHKPDVVILIDSLSCKDVKYLAKTFQINNCGLTPGCEVNNKQPKIDKVSLKTPVISIGCPVVTKLSNITKNSLDEQILTLKDIDIVIKKLADIISFSLNKVIHKNLTQEEIIFLSKN